jgi:hypothetical protein
MCHQVISVSRRLKKFCAVHETQNFITVYKIPPVESVDDDDDDDDNIINILLIYKYNNSVRQ